MPYKKKNYKKSKKNSKGWFIEPPKKLTPDFSVKNPTVSVDDSGSPYQRANDQLQSNTKNQAELNQNLNGNASNTSSGGKTRKTKKHKKVKSKKNIKKNINYFYILVR